MDFISNDIEGLRNVFRTSKSIVITCHLSPDGDALGSSLGLKQVLNNLNPNACVNVVTPDEPTRTLSFLPGYEDILAFSSHPVKVQHLVEKADLIVCLDFNELYRIDLLEPAIRSASAIKVHIDHHISPEDFADIRFSYPEKCATCMLLFEILESAGLGRYIDSNAATCLLTGMMTDTGDFTYNITDPGIFGVIGKLISLGADKARLTRILFNTFSESSLRIQGYAIAECMEVYRDDHAALIWLDRETLNRFGYSKGDTEGLVNKPLSIPGIIYSCFLREETDYIKVSMRSLGDFPVNELCAQYFGGGGHLNASGGEFHGSMTECIDLFKSLLKANKLKYIENNEIFNELL